jgi:threonine dehydratase
MALAAGVYSIPVYSKDSASSALDNVVGAEPTSPLDLRRLEIDSQRSAAPGSSDVTRPIPFPSNEDIDSVHGQGTIALELERELATHNSHSTHQHANKSRPDIVVSDLDSGITLSGICMAFANTGTHVFGAAPSEGFWDHAWSSHTPGAVPTQQDKGYRYWAGTKHPMSHIPWSTFTAPGYLSGIFEVNNEQVNAASIMARDHYQLHLHPDEAVPLAVALYNEEFQEFASKGAKRGRKRIVGVVLRSRKDHH